MLKGMPAFSTTTQLLYFFFKKQCAMRKSMYAIILSLILVWGAFTLSGCKDKPKRQASQFTEFEQKLTNADSSEVARLVEQFFQYAEQGKTSEAAGMLYKLENDSANSEPQLLDNKEMEKVRDLLNSLPIRGHEIDYMKFSDSDLNEVKCTAILAPAHDDKPEVKTAFYFKPIKYFDSWKLCIVDTNSGDQTIVPADKKDSLASEYSLEMRNKLHPRHR